MSARHETPEAADASGVTERAPASDPWAYDPTDRYSSRVVTGHEHQAGIPALFAAALAPVESAESIPAFASGALEQIAAESHRLVMAGLQVRAAASRMDAVGVLSTKDGGAR